MSPEPFSNWALSVLGDGVSLLGAILVTFHPIVIGGIAAAAALVSIFLVRWLWTSMRKLFRRPVSSATGTA